MVAVSWDDVGVGGPAAFRALCDAVDAAKAGDPLAPVTVVVPSALAGVTLRRALATRGAGMAAVSTIALPALAERLGAARIAKRGGTRATPLQAAAACRAVLIDDPRGFARVADHPATAEALLSAFSELRAVPAAALDRVGGDVVALARDYWARTGDAIDDVDVLHAATRAVEHGDASLDEVGNVIVYLPRRFEPAELDLLAALGARGRLTVLADGLPAGERLDVHVVRAADPADEARVAVRAVVDHLRDGGAPERVAIVSRVRSPYALLVHGELEAAGIAHSAPSPHRLAQSVAGRTLLSLLTWPANGHRRDDLIRMLRAAPVRNPAGGSTHPDRWDSIARNAGVVGGLDQWRARLAASRRRRVERLARDADRDESTDQADQPDQRLVDHDELLAFVEQLANDVERHDESDRKSWRELAVWARRLVNRYLGDPGATLAWSEPEQHAAQSVRDLLDELAELDAFLPRASVDEFRATLEHAMQPAAGRVGTFGQGVFVGNLADAAGADLDLIVVLGLAEGIFPPRPRVDALLDERVRAQLGLRAAGKTSEEESRDAWAALSSARRAVVTFPVADSRAERGCHPAPFVLDLVSQLAGRRIDTDDVPRLRDEPATARWFTDNRSFAWWTDSHQPAAIPEELEVSALAASADVGTPLVTAMNISNGLTASRARANGEFGPYTGSAGHWPELADDLVRPRSPTALQQWATCPFRYFLGHALDLGEREDPTEAETILAKDRGLLVHEVLERYVRSRVEAGIGDDAPDDVDLLLAIADDMERRYREEGKIGRRLLWDAEWKALRRHLVHVLEARRFDPRLAGLEPVEVEYGFGFGDGEPDAVEVDAGDGRVLRFGGRIDRIDRSADGTELVVLDYKTGRTDGYFDIGESDIDAVARGTLLQLPIYARAARAAYPEADDVAAYYWFVGRGGEIVLKGGLIDDAVDQRFDDVVGTIVSGIEHGIFPARPGDDDWRPSIGATHTNCIFCPYDRVCAEDRGEQWLRLREAGELAAYVELAEGEWGEDDREDDREDGDNGEEGTT